MLLTPTSSFFFFFNDTATTEIYTLSLHDALPISLGHMAEGVLSAQTDASIPQPLPFHWDLSWSSMLKRSEEHTSELQSPCNLVCRLLLEKKKKNKQQDHIVS